MRAVANYCLLAVVAVGSVCAQQPGEPGLPPGLDDSSGEEPADEREERFELPKGLHGFWDTRGASRLQDDPEQSEAAPLAETRLRVEYQRAWPRAVIDLKGDLLADGITDGLTYRQRQARLSLRRGRFDARLGRQVLTWGTGDLLFVNDLFPKDWVSFLSGRDEEYLKSPSDAVRVGWYHPTLNVEAVYTPVFEPDRFVTGERLSYWDPFTQRPAGERSRVVARVPDDPFEDDELALRIYRRFGSFELAAYGYSGRWKSPAGVDPSAGEVTFPVLAVYGASARGPVGRGIASVESGYYDSRDERAGSDPRVNNDELRLLVGYERELGRELTGGFQLYAERLVDYAAYRRSLTVGPARDAWRKVATVRLTKLLRSQTVRLSLFAFVGLSDRDLYVLPKARWQIDDQWSLEAGANLFAGDRDQTFFGQFENNSSLYAALRFSI